MSMTSRSSYTGFTRSVNQSEGEWVRYTCCVKGTLPIPPYLLSRVLRIYQPPSLSRSSPSISRVTLSPLYMKGNVLLDHKHMTKC